MNEDLKNTLKTYSFWFGLASAILLLVQTIGKPLGMQINEDIYMSVVNTVLGIFVVFGIISSPNTQSKTGAASETENKGEENMANEQNTIESNDTQNSEQVSNTFPQNTPAPKEEPKVLYGRHLDRLARQAQEALTENTQDLPTGECSLQNSVTEPEISNSSIDMSEVYIEIPQNLRETALEGNEHSISQDMRSLTDVESTEYAEDARVTASEASAELVLGAEDEKSSEAAEVQSIESTVGAENIEDAKAAEDIPAIGEDTAKVELSVQGEELEDSDKPTDIAAECEVIGDTALNNS